MNKIFSMSLFFSAALMFVGCAGEEDDIFDKSAAERLNETATIYTERLEASTGGWTMEYYPTTDTVAPYGMGYLMLVKFNNNSSVNIAMNNTYTNNAYLEDMSSYEVISDNGPVLTFNTYNKCLHTFSTPEDISSTSKDEQGTGFEGDYEFIMVDVPEGGDHIMLKGKKRGTYVRLSRLDEGEDFATNLADVNSFTKKLFPSTAPNLCKMNLGDSLLNVANMSTGRANLYPNDGDAIIDENNVPFLITKRGGKYYLRFKDALEAPDETTEQEFVYDEGKDVFVGIENENNIIKGEDALNFFLTTFSQIGTQWSMFGKDKSESMASLYDTMAKDLANYNSRSYSVENAYFVQESADCLRLVITLKFVNNEKDVSSSIAYLYNIASSDNEITLSYAGTASDTKAASSFYSLFSSLASFVNGVAGTYTVGGNETNFNLRDIRLTSVSDSNKWFSLTLN